MSKMRYQCDCVLVMALSWVADFLFLAVASHGGGGMGAFSGSFHKGTNPIHKLDPHDLITSPRPYLIIPSPWKLGFNISVWGVHKYSDPSKIT